MAEDIGRGLLVYGRRIPKAEIFARLDAVTAETIKVSSGGSQPPSRDWSTTSHISCCILMCSGIQGGMSHSAENDC